MEAQPVSSHVSSLGKDTAGTIRIGGTRVTLDTVLTAFQQGATPEEIMMRFEVLTLPQIYEAISYYLNHREQVASYLDEQHMKGKEIRQKLEEVGAAPNGAEVRERLLRRKEKAEKE